MAIIKKIINNKCWRGVKKREPSCTVGGNVNKTHMPLNGYFVNMTKSTQSKPAAFIMKTCGRYSHSDLFSSFFCSFLSLRQLQSLVSLTLWLQEFTKTGTRLECGERKYPGHLGSSLFTSYAVSGCGCVSPLLTPENHFISDLCFCQENISVIAWSSDPGSWIR